MLRRMGPLLLVVVAVALIAGVVTAQSGKTAAGTDWSMNATAIEACSCPMFCQCYFSTKPASHMGHEGHGDMERYCRANLAYKVNKGHYGAVKLDGAKFWLANDLGGDFSQGQMDWCVLYFDKATTPQQREALEVIVGKLFPVKWNSFKTAEGDIDTWEIKGQTAHATIDGGKTAEVKLAKTVSSNDAEPTVIKNLKYWGAPRNDGFILMPNEVEAYRAGDKAFEFSGTNGFLITVDIASKDFETKKN